MKIVISQPMYFPWVGLLEQIRLSDVFIHYDDVQFSRGLFNRVQIKREVGISWLTVPLRDLHRGQLISEVSIDNSFDWRSKHRDLLKSTYRNAPYFDEMLSLVDQVFSGKANSLADISRESVNALIKYYGLINKKSVLTSSSLKIPGKSSQRLLDICVEHNATSYITGHGARNYLDHNLFERSMIKVEYMSYKKLPYPQLNGDFTPFVTGLDLVANCGKDGIRYICSDSVYWKDFL